jgi:hypothetical protein
MADGDHDAIQGRLWDILWDILRDIGLPYAAAERRDHQQDSDNGKEGSSVHQENHRAAVPEDAARERKANPHRSHCYHGFPRFERSRDGDALPERIARRDGRAQGARCGAAAGNWGALNTMPLNKQSAHFRLLDVGLSRMQSLA